MRSSIPDKEKSFKGKYKIKYFSDVTEDKSYNPEMIKLCLDGEVLAAVEKMGDKFGSLQAAADVQDSGLLKDFAKAIGMKEEDIRYTALGVAVAQSSLKAEEDQKEQEKSSEKMKKSMDCKKTRLLKCWKSLKKEDDSFKKPSLYNVHVDGQVVNSRPMTIKEIEKEHGPIAKLESDPSIRVKAHQPKQPKATMSPSSRLLKSYQKLKKDVIDFKSKKKIIDSSPSKPSRPGIDDLRARMSQKPKMAPGSTDDKIKAALERQAGTNPFASVRTDATYGSPATSSKDIISSVNKPLKFVENKEVKSPKSELDRKSGLTEYLDKHADNDKVKNLALDMAMQGHDEPYAGGSFHNILHRTHDDQGHSFPVPNFGVLDPKGHLGKNVATGGPDPFAWHESKHGISKEVLKQHADKPLKISTRSDLIAQDDYIKHLNPDLHEVNMHIPSTNDNVTRRLEAGTPSLKRRMEAVKKLHDAGIKVNIIHDKIPGMNFSFNHVSREDLLPLLGIKSDRPSDKGIISKLGGKRGRKIGLLENQLKSSPDIADKLERVGLGVKR